MTTSDRLIKRGHVRDTAEFQLLLLARRIMVHTDTESFLLGSDGLSDPSEIYKILTPAEAALRDIREVMQLFHGWPGWPQVAAHRWMMLVGEPATRDVLHAYVDRRVTEQLGPELPNVTMVERILNDLL